MESKALKDLEKRVRQAASRLKKLQRENETLKQRLEAQRRHGGDGEAAWRRERAEIRRRVERVATRLESLLGG